MKGIRHIHLKVRDVERAARFYCDALGLEVGMTAAGGDMVFLRTKGDDDLLTLSAANLPSEVDGSVEVVCGASGGIDHFGIALGDDEAIEPVLDAVTRAGGTVLQQGEILGEPTAFVRDLDGYAIQIYRLPV